MSAITDYLNNETVPLDNRGKGWLDITQGAGVILPETTHFKLYSKRIVNSHILQEAYKSDEGIINAVYKEEKELT
jgi:hypothetical protein